MPGVALRGINGWLPPHVVDNDEVGARLAVSGSWILRRTGIGERRRADPGTAASDLAVRAAAPLLALSDGPVRTIVVATMSPDHPCPATAPLVAARLGLAGAAAWDVNAACAGFVYALACATALVSAGQTDRVLVIGTDVMSTVVDPDDRDTAVLFGDGAGAVLLETATPHEPGSFGPFDLGSDGALVDLVITPAGGSRRPASPSNGDGRYLRMQGQAVFKQAVDHMTASARAAVDAAGWTLDQVDWLIGHQANARILAVVGDVLGICPERRVVCLERTGNTATASIPLALHTLARSGKARAGDRVVLTSFGGGLSWGSTTMTWPSTLVVVPQQDPEEAST